MALKMKLLLLSLLLATNLVLTSVMAMEGEMKENKKNNQCKKSYRPSSSNHVGKLHERTLYPSSQNAKTQQKDKPSEQEKKDRFINSIKQQALEKDYQEIISGPITAPTLYLQGMGLTELPPNVYESTSLIRIYVENNKITAIRTKIKKLKQLEIFILTNNQLKKIPKGICGLTKLQYLNLEGNEPLTHIPDLTSLKNLNVLDITCCPNLDTTTLKHLHTLEIERKVRIHGLHDLLKKAGLKQQKEEKDFSPN